ncbi:MAG: MBL fold metallo-hydrolase [Acidimicrobiia bacterium]|nr:MBL fold metallo-hydrolase [Acidimicrobiia bacterium]
MKVYVIGSSGTFPIPGRPASGYLVEQDSTRVWLDAGPGTFTALPVDPDLVDAIVISHQHPDHCSDLLTAFHAWTYRPEPREAVPVYAPQAVWDRISGFFDDGQGTALPVTLDFHPVWTGDEVEIGDLGVSFVEMDHSVPTVGSRWEGRGRVLFYTGDTGPSGDWRSAVTGSHVMVSEASYQGNHEDQSYTQHLTAADAGRIAREAGVGKLFLTHIPPYLDAARSVFEAEQTFDRPVNLAVPGMTFEV